MKNLLIALLLASILVGCSSPVEPTPIEYVNVEIYYYRPPMFLSGVCNVKFSSTAIIKWYNGCIIKNNEYQTVKITVPVNTVLRATHVFYYLTEDNAGQWSIEYSSDVVMREFSVISNSTRFVIE